MNQTPCNRRQALFEPYRLEGETDDQRGHRLTLALSVCGSCPLKAKAACLKIGKEQDLARGVWGGTIISELDQRKEKQ